MLKNVAMTIVVAGVVAVVAPRNVQEVGTLTQRIGVALIQLGLILNPPVYDAAFDDDREIPNAPQSIGVSTDAPVEVGTAP